MTDLFQDIAFAWRNALKQPGTALLIVVTLALGIGANSAMFSVAWHVLLAPLPYEDGNRLVKLEQNEARGGRMNFGWSEPTVEDFRMQGAGFSDLASYDQLPITLVGQGDPYQAQAGIIDWNFFELLGISAVIGRTFTREDDVLGTEPVMLLSHNFWLSKFGGDPDAVGSTLETKNFTYRIVGVLPPIPAYPQYNDVWIPKVSNPFDLYETSPADTRRTVELLTHVLARLKPGVPLADASLEVRTIAQRLAASYPDDYAPDYSVSLKYLKEDMVGNSRLTIALLFGLAFLVVLIASANVASLNLAKMARRSQELAIREAIGAAPGRISRQLLTESILFALAGAVLGLLIAYPGLGLLADFANGYTPLASEISMDASLLLFSAFIAVVTGILSGSAGAFGRRDINKALKEGGDKVTASAAGVRRRQALLAIQFSLSFFILTMSALIMFSLYRLNDQDIGYDPDQVLAISLSLNLDLEGPVEFPVQMRNFGEQLLNEVKVMPGVAMASLQGGAPLLQNASLALVVPFDIEGFSAAGPGMNSRARIQLISEDYFRVMNIALLQGRMFSATDDGNAMPVAIVNESFTDRFFPDGNVIGQAVRLAGRRDWKTIVGVVGDIRPTALDQVEGPVVYYSFWQFPSEAINLYVKSTVDPNELAEPITGIIHDIDPQQAVASIKPLNAVKGEWLAPARLRATLISLFGFLALAVTLSGVIGVVSYNVSRRIREIGLYMAIGANPANVMNMFIFQGLKVYLFGLLLGVALMRAGAPVIQPLLYETSAVDAGIYLASALLLSLAVLVALYLPARKAGAMSPAAALHVE